MAARAATLPPTAHAAPLSSVAALLPRAQSHPNRITTSKYSLLTFLPLNIYHQLSKPSTLFFFVTAILICIPAISPFEPWSYIIAFLIVIGVSIVKDAIEDYGRHRSDRAINERTCRVLRRSQLGGLALEEIKIMDLTVGDWLWLQKEEEAHADIVVMRGVIAGQSGCTAHCFIDTSNLDGESNLKKRRALAQGSCRTAATRDTPPATPGSRLPCDCAEYLHSGLESITLHDTGDSFSDFRCEIVLHGRRICASERNTLLRGSILKNTDYALCLVVAVGTGTKQYISTSRAVKQKSLFGRQMDYTLLLVGLIYAAILLATAAVGAYMVYWNDNTLYINGGARISEVVCLIFSNYILYSYLIPLSLYVMVEVARFAHAQFVSFDPAMAVNGQRAVCRNSNVIEDLGMVDYLLTDKTGTITKNSMTLRALHVPGTSAPSRVETKLAEWARAPWHSGAADTCTRISATESPIPIDFTGDLLFLLNILICNSVETLNGEYQGLSQDELCFLKTLAAHGYALLEREEHFVRVRVGQWEITAEILYALEFTSRRQYMSAVVRLAGRCFLFCKGADQRLLDPVRDADTVRIVNCAGDYRSLVLRCRELTAAEAAAVCARPVPRERLAGLHQNMAYLGTTFIEDELQEGVPETMAALHKAGIRVWMITGDKQETAVCCARNAGIIRGDPYRVAEGKEVVRMLEALAPAATDSAANGPSTPLLGVALDAAPPDRAASEARDADASSTSASAEIAAVNAPEPADAARARTISTLANTPISGEPGAPTVSNTSTHTTACTARAVTSGASLDASPVSSATSAATTALFPGELFSFNSLIIYRATPAQKGRIADLLRQVGRHVLAIGDGNNDVAMLRHAHVGVGIMGKEGTQASLSADFALPRFALLQNLVLTHGRYNLIRYSKISLNAFYKNVLFIFVQFFYNFCNGASGRAIYNDFFMNYYNLFFTSMVPITMAVFDRDECPQSVLRNPASYRQARAYFSRPLICAHLAYAGGEAALLFAVVAGFMRMDLCGASGLLGGAAVMSTMISVAVFVAVLLRQYRQVGFVVWYTYAALALSVGFMLVLLLGLQDVAVGSNAAVYRLLTMPAAYLVLVALITAVYVADEIFEVLCEGLIKKHGYEAVRG